MKVDDIPYEIEYTKNRHSRAVYRDGMITIRLARWLTRSQQQEHIDHLLDRMISRVKKDRNRQLINPFEGEEDPKSCWRALASKELDHITALVQKINVETMNVPIQKVKLSLMKSQWGSCAPSGNISLNTALLFVPEELLEYVIIHELAHRVHANHSPRFWKLVEEHCPNYKKHRKALRKYRLPE